MRFSNEVRIAAPPDELFAFVRDVERVAPCLPGARIVGRDGDDYAGTMNVRVGPVNAKYEGRIRHLEIDPDARRVVMRARGDDVGGGGNAEAQIATQVEPTDNGSILRLDTDLQVRGRVAQFGRGAMESISKRMFEQLAENIERSFAPRPSERAASGGPTVDPAAPASGSAPEEQAGFDALALLAQPARERIAPFVVPALLGFLYGYLLGRLRESRRGS